MNFIQRIEKSWRAGHQLCIGLDPFMERLPAAFKNKPKGILHFNQAIIDATWDLACCFKPQFAHFAAEQAEDQLRASIGYIKAHYPDVPVILDSKRGDIGSTASMYAREAFEHYQADAVTINPYMGSDTVLPFADYADKGVFVLCRTSNPSAGEFQNLSMDGEPLYLHVARQAQNKWNQHRNICLVVGATAPEDMAKIRAVAPDIPFLVPGIGAQGGDLAAVIQNGRTTAGQGLIINASRSVLYASDQEDYAQAARAEAQRLNEQIRQISLQLG